MRRRGFVRSAEPEWYAVRVRRTMARDSVTTVTSHADAVTTARRTLALDYSVRAIQVQNLRGGGDEVLAVDARGERVLHYRAVLGGDLLGIYPLLPQGVPPRVLTLGIA